MPDAIPADMHQMKNTNGTKNHGARHHQGKLLLENHAPPTNKLSIITH
ncbi:MAG: hypothetical protein HRU39_09805 [Salinicola sp.]|nr:hypothetical protein [Salinicola sp.]NRB56256.1 hypothetical protein [Salinicola sp.]